MVIVKNMLLNFFQYLFKHFKRIVQCGALVDEHQDNLAIEQSLAHGPNPTSLLS